MTPLIAILAMTQEKPPVLPKQEWNTVSGQALHLPSPGAKATVLLFVAVDCPISNRYAPEYVRLWDDFSNKGVSFVRVYVDDSVATGDIVQHGKDFGLVSPAILDGKHVLVKQLGITVTPEAAVIGPDGTLCYRGRINDINVEHGLQRDGTKARQDLRVAIDEILARKPVSQPFTTAIGCGIPDGR